MEVKILAFKFVLLPNVSIFVPVNNNKGKQVLLPANQKLLNLTNQHYELLRNRT